MNISQQILALDARYNAYRVPNNPQYRKYSSLIAAFKYKLCIYMRLQANYGRIFIINLTLYNLACISADMML